MDGPKLTGCSLIPVPSFNLILFIRLCWSCSCCPAWVSVAWPFQGIPAQFPTANTCVSLLKGFSGTEAFSACERGDEGLTSPPPLPLPSPHSLRITLFFTQFRAVSQRSQACLGSQGNPLVGSFSSCSISPLPGRCLLESPTCTRAIVSGLSLGILKLRHAPCARH